MSEEEVQSRLRDFVDLTNDEELEEEEVHDQPREIEVSDQQSRNDTRPPQLQVALRKSVQPSEGKCYGRGRKRAPLMMRATNHWETQNPRAQIKSGANQEEGNKRRIQRSNSSHEPLNNARQAQPHVALRQSAQPSEEKCYGRGRKRAPLMMRAKNHWETQHPRTKTKSGAKQEEGNNRRIQRSTSSHEPMYDKLKKHDFFYY